MIDLHTHTILSDGCLLPSELVRRAYVLGYRAIAITDHVDHSNIDTVISGLVKTAKVLNKYWDILVIPGVEITHVPLESFKELVRYARKRGALIIVGHGESPVEPVISGTNRAAIEAGVDILAHPGLISEADAKLAASRGVYLEITSRRGHSQTNKHVYDLAYNTGAKLLLNTDTHSPEDLLTDEKAKDFLKALTGRDDVYSIAMENAGKIVNRFHFS